MALLLTLVLAALVTALLTPDDLSNTGFMLGIAVVHLLFGFVYGSWWATRDH